MDFPLPIPDELRQRLAGGTEVLLGLSGGVDSAVALAFLTGLGCRVQCVTFKNFCTSDGGIETTEKSCCSLDAIRDARALALRFGAQHWVHDVAEPFAREVIEPFVAEYRAGRTPNPCLGCNGEVRFPELVRLARRQGCALAATGHYARVAATGQPPRWDLLRGLDAQKDQSYFLSRLPAALLPSLVFPLGWWTKPQIREAAVELGLSVARKPDSQEICFVPDGDRSFLFDGDEAARPGPIVDREGRVLGTHRGLVHYTVGQRRGLGVAAAHPLYVLELDLERGRLVVGPAEQLAVTRLEADRFRALAELPRTPLPGALTARIRHRHRGAPVRDWSLQDDRLSVELAEPVRGVAPGQGLVLYEGDRVLGCGRLLGAR